LERHLLASGSVIALGVVPTGRTMRSGLMRVSDSISNGAIGVRPQERPGGLSHNSK